MSSFLNSDSFEAGVGNAPNIFARVDNAAMLVSATTGYGFSFRKVEARQPSANVTSSPISFSKTSVVADSSSAYDRWTFLKKGADGKTLHEKISDKIKEGLEPQACALLEQQEVAFEKAFRNWVVTADFGMKEPDINDYQQLKAHLRNVQSTESGISRMVIESLTAEEKIAFNLEAEPLKPGQMSQQMSEQVVKRITEATQRFLDNNQFSQREHNRT